MQLSLYKQTHVNDILFVPFASVNETNVALVCVLQIGGIVLLPWRFEVV